MILDFLLFFSISIEFHVSITDKKKLNYEIFYIFYINTEWYAVINLIYTFFTVFANKLKI